MAKVWLKIPQETVKCQKVPKGSYTAFLEHHRGVSCSKFKKNCIGNFFSHTVPPDEWKVFSTTQVGNNWHNVRKQKKDVYISFRTEIPSKCLSDKESIIKTPVL